jgi:hypothetical protein
MTAMSLSVPPIDAPPRPVRRLLPGQSDFIAASIALRSDVLSALNALRDAAA